MMKSQRLGGNVGQLMVSLFGLLHILSWLFPWLTTWLRCPLAIMSDLDLPLRPHLFPRFKARLDPADVRMSGKLWLKWAWVSLSRLESWNRVVRTVS